MIMRDVLSSAGYELIEAVNGEDGVKLAHSERPDLILMDIQLPIIDGYEATRHQGQHRAQVDSNHRCDILCVEWRPDQGSRCRL